MLLFLALALTAFTLYVPRTCRTVALMGDSAELVTAAANWGVPHPPGYPLYTGIAHAMTRLLPFELPFRVHLLSAFFHAVTVGIVGSIIEIITDSLPAAFIGAATLALGRTFFLGSLYAEVFPLNDLLFAALLGLAIRTALETAEERGLRKCAKGTALHPPRRGSRFLLMATVLGLASAHHHMIAFALPALALLVGGRAAREMRQRPRVGVGALLCAILPPFFFYALVPIAAAREPIPSWGDVHDVASLWRLVTRQDYGGVMHASRHLVDGQLLERLDAVVTATINSFGATGFLLFLGGLQWGFRHARRIGFALVTAIVCTGPLFASLNAFDLHSDYRIGFFERFTTMCHVPFAVVVGLGVAQCGQWLAAVPRLSPALARGMLGVVAVLALVPLFNPSASLDMGRQRRGRAYVHDLIDSAPDGALVLLKSDMASQAALYACGVERRCGSRIVLAPGQLWMPWKRAEVARSHPDLPLPPPDLSSAARWLVEQSLPVRPVVIHPELVDEVVHGDLSILPSLLLFRVYPDERALRSDLPRFRKQVDDVASGHRCEGCFNDRLGASGSPADAQVARIYEAALGAQATASAQLERSERVGPLP